MLNTAYQSLPSLTDITAYAAASKGFIYLKPVAVATTAKIAATTFVLDRASGIALNFIGNTRCVSKMRRCLPEPVRDLARMSIRLIRFSGSVAGAFLLNTNMNYALLTTHAPIFAASVIGAYIMCNLAKATVICAYRTCRVAFYDNMVAQELVKFEQMRQGKHGDVDAERQLIAQKRTAITEELERRGWSKDSLQDIPRVEERISRNKEYGGQFKHLALIEGALVARLKVLNQQEELLVPAEGNAV